MPASENENASTKHEKHASIFDEAGPKPIKTTSFPSDSFETDKTIPYPSIPIADDSTAVNTLQFDPRITSYYEEIAQPVQLRMKAGKVQMLIRVVSYVMNTPYPSKSETKELVWRDIPEVADDAPDYETG